MPDPDPPPPYSLLSTPVYSLAARSVGGATMNIVTYACPIAIKPKRKMVLGLYVGTLSWQNVKETGEGVLQVGGWVWGWGRCR